MQDEFTGAGLTLDFPVIYSCDKLQRRDCEMWWYPLLSLRKGGVMFYVHIRASHRHHAVQALKI